MQRATYLVPIIPAFVRQVGSFGNNEMWRMEARREVRTVFFGGLQRRS